MVKLSVVVPCYNVENYLNMCVDSILANKVDMEIILVNDGSLDNTLKIINEYKKKYPKIIKVVDQKNGGLSAARNAGIKVAKGEYIAFVDSDDSISNNMYEEMLDKAISNNFDLVICGEVRVYPTFNKNIDVSIKNDCYSKADIKKIMPIINPAAWNKLYKRELFDNLKFKVGVVYEDVEFIYRLLPTISSLGVVDGHYYNYYQREGSITYTYNEKLYDIVNNLNGVVEYYKDKGFYDDYKEEIEYSYVRYLYATFIKRLARCKNKKEFKRGVKCVISNVNKLFPNYKNNIYLKGCKGLYLKYFNSFVANVIYYIEKDRKN